MQKPWEVHPDLTEERLLAIGKIISKVRKGALAQYDTSAGDGPWSLECTIYERTMNNFLAAAKEFSWLRCIRRNLYFLVLVGKVPIRFKRIDFEKAGTMDIRLFHTEVIVHQLAFDYDQSGWYWRVFIETDEFRDILRLVIAQVTEAGLTRNPFNIPLSGQVTLAAPVNPIRREAAAVEKPAVGVKKKSSEEKVAENGDKE